MIIVQSVLIIFLLFAVSRVIIQFHHHQIKVAEFFFWTGLFLIAIITIAFPSETTGLANSLGIGRGVDLILYVSIALLFYLIFRVNVYLEEIRHEITELVRRLALKNAKHKK